MMGNSVAVPRPTVTVHSVDRYDGSSADVILPHLPEGSPRLILIKPNWVRHAESPSFPVEALVTDSRLIEAVIEACLRKYSGVEEILVGDVPLQDCDWELLCGQAGIRALQSTFASHRDPTVTFVDLRRERFSSKDGFMVNATSDAHGDPRGYQRVELGSESFLDEISDQRGLFRVSGYAPKLTQQSHHRGRHDYLIAGSVLAADLVINLPKMKTHQKAGVTGALKNLVGINGEKGYLVHYRMGCDEFAPGSSWPIRLQVRLREFLQKRSRLLFVLLGKPWRVFRRVYGIRTDATREHLSDPKLYNAGGAWFGNDTVWRMVYDLNRILRYATRDGHMSNVPQRRVVSICDGRISGEGNGPLQPLPVGTGVILVSEDPFAMDVVMARLMGFDYRRIPLLANHSRFDDAVWGQFDPSRMCVDVDDRSLMGIDAVPVLQRFHAPPGWQNQVELSSTDTE